MCVNAIQFTLLDTYSLIVCTYGQLGVKQYQWWTSSHYPTDLTVMH